MRRDPNTKDSYINSGDDSCRDPSHFDDSPFVLGDDVNAVDDNLH